MRTIETVVYKFDELSDEAKQAAIDKMRNINIEDSDWHQSAIEYWTEKLNDIGFTDVKIRYSGFWSQGDGASFTSSADNLKLLDHLIANGEKQFRLLRCIAKYNIDIRIESISHHYCHERTARAVASINNTHDRISARVTQLEESLETLRLDLCSDIYKALEEDYNYLTSDEAIIETIEANDYEFTIDGKLS